MKHTTRTFLEVQSEIAVIRETLVNGKLTTWRKVGEHWPGVTPATLCAIYKHKREPTKSRIRGLLGLPCYAPVPVCPIHGVVHLTKRCPRKARPKPNPPYEWGEAMGFIYADQ